MKDIWRALLLGIGKSLSSSKWWVSADKSRSTFIVPRSGPCWPSVSAAPSRSYKCPPRPPSPPCPAWCRWQWSSLSVLLQHWRKPHGYLRKLFLSWSWGFHLQANESWFETTVFLPTLLPTSRFCPFTNGIVLALGKVLTELTIPLLWQHGHVRNKTMSPWPRVNMQMHLLVCKV